jgi:hypothetical protein
MESKFQASFIPKKPITVSSESPRRGVSFLSLAGVILLLVTIALSVGVFLWKAYLDKSISSMSGQLQSAEATFDPSTINQLIQTDKQIETAKTLLSQHVAFSAFFDLLSQITLKSVRFNSFSYSMSNQKININMSGQANSFASVALQSDVFAQNSKYIQDPLISNLALDSSTGNVNFAFTATIDPSLVSYSRTLSQTTDAVQALPASSATSSQSSAAASTTVPVATSTNSTAK